MFFRRKKEQERKKRLFDIEVEKEECFGLREGLGKLPEVEKALEGILHMDSVFDEVCFRTLVGEDVPGGRTEIAAIKLFFVETETVLRAIRALEELGVKASARNYGLHGAVWEISFWPARPNRR